MVVTQFYRRLTVVEPAVRHGLRTLRVVPRITTFLAMLVLCGCSGASHSPGSAATATTGSSAVPTTVATTTTLPATSATVDPNAPEVNAAGDIPDNQVFVPFTFAAGPFTVSVPEGWARTDESQTTTFTDNFNSVRLLAVDAASAPTVQSARDNEVPAIQASSTNFHLDGVSSVDRKGGGAVLIKYQADSAPNPVTGAIRPLAFERYEFWRNGREGIVVLSGPVGADNVDPWRTVSDSFTWS
jgi:hypothetical protein